MQEHPAASLSLPKRIRAIVGSCLFTGFLGFFVALAIRNLLNGIAIIASILWLLLIATVLFGACKDRGVKQVLKEVLGSFARKQFVWAVLSGTAQTEIRFGYQIFGSRYYYLTVPADKIEEVHWSTGQASSIAGRDMDDWSVALWYFHGDAAKTHRNLPKSDQKVYIVGPTGPKNEVAAFGQRFLTFLDEAGVRLVQGENDCSFVRQSSG